ncbi:hypothetical protein P9X10_01145 [Bacillus cereus]|nr:hypothetical protein [Bacillus cereus]
MNESSIHLVLRTEYGNFKVGEIKRNKEGKFNRPEISFEQVVVSPTILTEPTVEAHINLEGYANCNHETYLVLISVTHIIQDKDFKSGTSLHIITTSFWEDREELEVIPFEPYDGTIEDFCNYAGRRIQSSETVNMGDLIG